MGNRLVFKSTDDIDEGIYALQVSQRRRILAVALDEPCDVDVLDSGVREFLGIEKRGKLV